MSTSIATAKALSHPLRIAILTTMAANEPTSPNRLSVEMNEPLGNVSYHVKTLLEYKMVELDRTEPRRGAVEHFYRRTSKANGVGAFDEGAALDQIAALVHRFLDGADEDFPISKLHAILRRTGRE